MITLMLKFHSTVIMTNDFNTMKSFYIDILQQEIEFDFGNCIGLKCGLSLWKLQKDYPISNYLGRTYDQNGNKNLEICFDTDFFDIITENLKKYKLNYLHHVVEEKWGQKTIRFYDPENNLIEIGETIDSFVKRFYNLGLSDVEISNKTSVPIDYVRQCINKPNETT